MSGPLRIIQVSAYGLGRHGGVQSHVRDLAAALRQRGHDVRCFSPGGAISASADHEEIGLQRSIGLGGTRFELSYLPRRMLHDLRNDIAIWQPDLVHFHGLWVPVMPAQLFWHLPAARAVTFHDTTAPGLTGGILRSLFRPLGKLIAGKVDAAIAVSAAPMAHLGPASARRAITILPPVTDLSDFLGLTKPVPQGPPVVLHWGRLDRRKNIAALLEAARLIWQEPPHPQDGPRPRFIIASDGEDAELVRRASRELGPEIVLHLPPPDRQDLLRLLRLAQLCVFPALYGESFGIVLAESLASGTPVLAADNPGFRALLGPSGADCIQDCTDPRLLANRIKALLRDPDRLTALAASGRAHARQFDVSAHVGTFERLYAEALSARRSKDDG